MKKPTPNFSQADEKDFDRLERGKGWLDTTLGQRIRYIRYKKNLRQEDITNICGISQSVLTNVEHDIKSPLYIVELALEAQILLYTKVKAMYLSTDEMVLLENYREFPSRKVDNIHQLLDRNRIIEQPIRHLGVRLKLRRKHLGLSQPELSNITGISQSLISAIEIGKKHRTHKVLEFALHCKCPPEWLILEHASEDAKKVRVIQQEVDFILTYRRQSLAIKKKIAAKVNIKS